MQSGLSVGPMTSLLRTYRLLSVIVHCVQVIVYHYTLCSVLELACERAKCAPSAELCEWSLWKLYVLSFCRYLSVKLLLIFFLFPKRYALNPEKEDPGCFPCYSYMKGTEGLG